MVLFKGERCRVSPRFRLFVSDVNQWNEGAGCAQDILAGMERFLLDLTQAVKNVVGCDSVWN